MTRPGRALLVAAAFLLGAAAFRAERPPQVVHAYVALCDNETQGIVPVPPRIGNGDDPERNLYWGSGEGLRTVFSRSREWKLVARPAPGASWVLERCVFRHVSGNAYLVADAYRGAEIRRAIEDFFAASVGENHQEVRITLEGKTVTLPCGGQSSLVAYLGHNGLMDFPAPPFPQGARSGGMLAVLLCCMSEQYFGTLLREKGVVPLLTTKQLMYPGAFLLEAALDGWLRGETPAGIRERAAEAYARNQKIDLAAARGVFAKP